MERAFKIQCGDSNYGEIKKSNSKGKIGQVILIHGLIYTEAPIKDPA
jgi:hypothetical protein